MKFNSGMKQVMKLLFQSKTTIIQSWRRSTVSISCSIILHALQNACLCIPLIGLKLTLGQRAAAMERKFFPQLPTEQYSLIVVDGLLYGSLAFFLSVAPLSQIGLAMAYFKWGHSWSRVLRDSRHIKDVKETSVATNVYSTDL